MGLFVLFAATLLALALVFLLPPLFSSRRNGDAAEVDRDAHNVAIARDRLKELKVELASGKMDKTEFAQAKLELERTLAMDLADEESAPADAADSGNKAVIVLVAVVVLAMSVGLYGYLGSPQGIGVIGPGKPAPAITAADNQPLGPDGEPLPGMDVLVENLAEKLEQEPDNPDGWRMLARGYAMMGRWTEAAEAWRQAADTERQP